MGVKKGDYIHVILCEPGKEARVTTIMNNLESLQKMAKGYIEAVYPFDDPVAIVCNEEGKINGLELNRSLRDEKGKIYDIIAGPFLVVGLGEEDFTSLEKEYQDKYCKLFKKPEMFFRTGQTIHSVPVDIPDRPRTSVRK